MSPTGEVSGHVMLSFHQSSKPVVLRLREKMRTAGYKMWMDIEGWLPFCFFKALIFLIVIMLIMVINIQVLSLFKRNNVILAVYSLNLKRGLRML